MVKHSCDLTGARPGTSFRCPECRTTWRWNPRAGAGTDLWHGRDNVRTASGAKPRGGLWAWLTS